jgi:hypothetical protein
MTFKLPNQEKSHRKSSNEEAAPGTPIFRKDLGGGILAEANDDGTMFVSNKLTPGSKEERQVLMHEMIHMTHMKTGKLGYDDDIVYWNGEEYPRTDDGHIIYEGKKLQEGDPKLPWEQMPWNA